MNWDYTELAQHYDKRPDYSKPALAALFDQTGLDADWSVIDMGAGTGMLTKHLCATGCRVTAIEPNQAMRDIGQNKIAAPHCRWLDASAEKTGLAEESFDMVIFGSSFNVVNQDKALKESARLLKPGGWFACLWNHRDLSDPLQDAVEQLIHSYLPGYAYGKRRQEQTPVIEASGLFHAPKKIEAGFSTQPSTTAYLDAWRSHATLARQAGHLFPHIIQAITNLLADQRFLEVPYHTRIWYAQKNH